MYSRVDLEHKVEAILRRLRSGLTEEDVQSGWTERARDAMIVFFDRMLRDVHTGQSLMPLEYRTILRGLDHWGVVAGELFDKAAEISANVAVLIRQSSCADVRR
jgi:hypothetical protein